MLAAKRGQRRLDFGIAADTSGDRLYRQRSGGGFEWTQEICPATGRRVRIEHDCRPFDAGRYLLEQLQPLATHRGFHIDEPRDVASGAR